MVSSGALALGCARGGEIGNQANRETGSEPHRGAGVDLLNYLKVNCVDQTRSNPGCVGPRVGKRCRWGWLVTSYPDFDNQPWRHGGGHMAYSCWGEIGLCKVTG